MPKFENGNETSTNVYMYCSDRMNFTTHTLDVVVDGSQVEEVVKALYHTILFHRTIGKFNYKQDSTYSVGTVGVQETDCSTVDFTYVQSEAPDLDSWLTSHVVNFAASLRQKPPPVTGQMLLEFYERKKGRWLLPGETVSWEAWQLKVKVARIGSEEDWLKHQAALSSAMAEKVLTITDIISKSEYLPKMPLADDLGNVYDVRFQHVQPYLHRLSYELQGESMGSTVRKFIQNTFNY